jgi:hypothetical protein
MPSFPPSGNHKPDPYNGFKADSERRRALNTKVIWQSIAIMVVAIAADVEKGLALFRALTHLFK